MNNILGTYLEEARKTKKLSLREAAEKSGVSYTYIRDIELGTNRKTKKEVKPSSDTLKKLASAYGVDYYIVLEKAGIIDDTSLEEADKKLDKFLNQTDPLNGMYRPIPLIGTICAGEGILAEQNIEEYIQYPFPKHKRQPDYALHVKGNSMIGAGIEDGDIVFMKHSPWAEYNGQIVAAIINDAEDGTLKRMKWTEGSNMFTLDPENENFESIEVLPNEVKICGVYVGHFKMDKHVN